LYVSKIEVEFQQTCNIDNPVLFQYFTEELISSVKKI